MTSHNKLKEYFDQLCLLFEQTFGNFDNKLLPFQKKDHKWLNYFYKSPLFRHIHLEYYKTNKICVLHANTFPSPCVDIPILGFDMIALGDKITGLFFDFTPTFVTHSKLDYNLDRLHTNYKSKKRQLPEWADFFSNKFYCIEPLPEELSFIMTDVIQGINNYFEICKDEMLKYNLRIKKQNTYCQGQKKNDKTLKALAAEIGDKNASLFLNDYLFPEIKIT